MVGLSNHDAAQLEAAERLGHVDTLQPPFSAIRREAAAAELPWCAEHNTGVIAYSVLQSGLLSGSFKLSALPQNDWRARGPDYNKAGGAEFAGEPLRQNLALADALKPIAARHGVTVPAVAAAWALAWPGVTAAIMGTRRPDQVDGWISATTLELTRADLQEIADAIAEPMPAPVRRCRLCKAERRPPRRPVRLAWNSGRDRCVSGRRVRRSPIASREGRCKRKNARRAGRRCLRSRRSDANAIKSFRSHARWRGGSGI